MRVEIMAVRRAFAIEGEAAAVVANLDQPHRPGMPLQIGGIMPGLMLRCGLPHSGPERILEEKMLEIGEQQLLMLLFMIEPEREQVGAALRDQWHGVQHGLVDAAAIVDHVGEAGPRQQAALGPRMARAFRFIIAVEQERPALVVQLVAGNMVAQDERLEKPGEMRKMPFGGGRVRHRLRRRVAVGERRGQIEAERAHGEIVRGEALHVHARGRPKTSSRLVHYFTPFLPARDRSEACTSLRASATLVTSRALLISTPAMPPPAAACACRRPDRPSSSLRA